MASDWDASDDEQTTTNAKTTTTTTAAPTVARLKGKFDDEDKSDNDIQDDWDVSEDETTAKPAVEVDPGPIRQKGITKKKIAQQKEEQERLEALEREREEEAANPTLRKIRDREETVRADLENARGLLGNMSMDEGDSSNPLTMTVNSKEDFEELSKKLANIIVSRYGSHKAYASFVESHVKALSEPLKDIEVRKCASSLTVIANEKQRATATKKKKATKPSLNTGGTERSTARSSVKQREVADAFEDGDDDFM